MSYQQPRPQPEPDPDTPSGLTVNAGRLWAGGVATAIVAALAAVVGILVCSGVFDVPVFVPAGAGKWDVASALPFALAAAGAALLATGLMHLLLVGTPRPRLFFGWISALITVIVGVLPFTTDLSLERQVASAIVAVLVAVVIASLVSGTAERSVEQGPRAA